MIKKVVSKTRRVRARSVGNQGQAALPPSNGANLGFEKKLWEAADKLRSNMDAAEYKHVCLAQVQGDPEGVLPRGRGDDNQVLGVRSSHL